LVITELTAGGSGSECGNYGEWLEQNGRARFARSRRAAPPAGFSRSSLGPSTFTHIYLPRLTPSIHHSAHSKEGLGSPRTCMGLGGPTRSTAGTDCSHSISGQCASWPGQARSMCLWLRLHFEKK
uniref:Uncharacterized protein n=1 Tax=Scleropages formosus TaxID=113540 RepID=A0A8C9VV85_SCLFO